MKHYQITALFLCLSVAACVDMKSVSMVEEFRVLGVQAEPQEIAPGEETVLRVLWSDPNGKGREVWFAWMGCTGIVHASQGIATCDMIVPPVVRSAALGGDVFTISATPSDIPAGPTEGASSLDVTFIVIMCAGGTLPAPEAYDGLRDTKYIDTLCRGGDGQSAFKSVAITGADSPRENPVISGFSLNGQPLDPADDGGLGSVACKKRDKCGIEVPVALSVDRASYQTFETIEFGAAVSVEETVFVSWFVTGGDFEESRSVPSKPYGPFENTWSPEAPGTYTLYAVAHDTRGGAAWQTYSVTVAPR